MPAGERERKLDVMSDAPSHRELDAKLEASEARTDAKFAGLGGRLDAISGKLDAIRNGQLAMAGLIIAALGIVIAVMVYGAQWFGVGLQSHDVLTAAARDGAAQALAATNRVGR